MKNIITYDGRPIYLSDDTIDYVKVAKALEVHSSFVFDFEEWRRIPDVTISQMITGYDLRTFVWNVLQNDWVEQL